uniref:EB domain-containing protein n=1 Tax=Romanomermis culicivorax TaxID=13658 RepID=A0A915IF73_ROMCU
MIQNLLILFYISNHLTCDGQRPRGRSSYDSNSIEGLKNWQPEVTSEHILKNVGYSTISPRRRQNVIFCRTSSQCSSVFPESLCRENVCVCRPGRIFDSEKGVCSSPLARSSLTTAKRSFEEGNPTFLVSAGKPCNDAGFCGGGSFCDQNTGLCTCPRGKFIHNGGCVGAPHLGQVGEQNPVLSHQIRIKSPRIIVDDMDQQTTTTLVQKATDLTPEVQHVEQRYVPRVVSPLRRRTAAFLCPMNIEPYFKVDGEDKAYIMCNASRPTACPPLSYCFATGRALESGPYYCCPSN